MDAKKQRVVGINIQYPISRLILDGSKTVETRTYAIPPSYVGQTMAIIETPGAKGHFAARIVGIIVFGESFKYESKAAFYKDVARHKVTPDSPWRWGDKPKFGWPILKVSRFKTPKPAPANKGIRYTANLEI